MRCEVPIMEIQWTSPFVIDAGHSKFESLWIREGLWDSVKTNWKMYENNWSQYNTTKFFQGCYTGWNSVNFHWTSETLTDSNLECIYYARADFF